VVNKTVYLTKIRAYAMHLKIDFEFKPAVFVVCLHGDRPTMLKLLIHRRLKRCMCALGNFQGDCH